MSNSMKRFVKQLKIKQYKTTAFYPQANGVLERSHLVLIEYLKQYVNKFTEWNELLEYATISYIVIPTFMNQPDILYMSWCLVN